MIASMVVGFLVGAALMAAYLGLRRIFERDIES